jgi:hypothetical protein
MIGTVNEDTSLVLKLAPASNERHSMAGYSPQAYKLKKSQILEGMSGDDNK